MKGATNSFNVFMEETGGTGKAYMNMVMQQAKSSALDEKVRELAYIAVLSAIRMTGGLNLHVKNAKKLGASRDEVKSAVIVGLPAVGITVIDSLEIALNAYDEI